MYKRGTKSRLTVFKMTLLLLVFIILWLAVPMIQKYIERDKEEQFTASLGGTCDTEELLEEARKIDGIRSIYPVLEIPLRLKYKGYTMDTMAEAVEIEKLFMKAVQVRDVPIGEAPVLLLGKSTLALFKDENHHALSEEQQKKLIKGYEDIKLTYQIKGGGDEEKWKECHVAAILNEPEDKIYMPYTQGVSFCRKNGDRKIKKLLITVKGAEAAKRAKGYFKISR